jgi:hypothetical protein
LMTVTVRGVAMASASTTKARGPEGGKPAAREPR